MAPQYPTTAEIRQVLDAFAAGDRAKFIDRLSDDLDWFITESGPLSGHFTKKEFLDGALGRLRKVMKAPLKLTIINVIGGGDTAWACAECHTSGECLDGMKFEHDYVWMLKFDVEGMIVEGKGYPDTDLLRKAIEQGEKS